MHNQKPEILINASQVTQDGLGDTFEFVMNDLLHVIDCVKIDNAPSNDKFKPIRNPAASLDTMLFELNHVRVNPKLDNADIIDCFSSALISIGVNIRNRPAANSMQVCYKPIGEITDNVRFYLNPLGKVMFLSPATKPKLVQINNQQQNYF